MRKQALITGPGLIAAAVLAVAACGSSSPPSPTPAASQSQAAGPYAFSRCMRAHGVDIPDPHVSVHGGETSISQMMPASVAAAPAFKGAQKACADLQPGPQSNRPDRQGPSAQTLLAFTGCLRAHGLNTFPDPNRQGQITPQMLTAAGVDVRAPAFLTAARRCLSVTHGQITLAQVAAAARGPQ